MGKNGITIKLRGGAMSGWEHYVKRGRDAQLKIRIYNQIGIFDGELDDAQFEALAEQKDDPEEITLTNIKVFSYKAGTYPVEDYEQYVFELPAEYDSDEEGDDDDDDDGNDDDDEEEE